MKTFRAGVIISGRSVVGRLLAFTRALGSSARAHAAVTAGPRRLRRDHRGFDRVVAERASHLELSVGGRGGAASVSSRAAAHLACSWDTSPSTRSAIVRDATRGSL